MLYTIFSTASEELLFCAIQSHSESVFLEQYRILSVAFTCSSHERFANSCIFVIQATNHGKLEVLLDNPAISSKLECQDNEAPPAHQQAAAVIHRHQPSVPIHIDNYCEVNMGFAYQQKRTLPRSNDLRQNRIACTQAQELADLITGYILVTCFDKFVGLLSRCRASPVAR